MESARIPVDSEVLAELVRRLESPHDSLNAVLRRLLGLPVSGVERDAAAESHAVAAAESATIGHASADSGDSSDSGARAISSESPESEESARPAAPPLPPGSELRARFKGREIRAHVRDGVIELDGRRFTSLSAAARAVTGHPTNGWRFFEARLPGRQDWLPALLLRPTRGRRAAGQ